MTDQMVADTARDRACRQLLLARRISRLMFFYAAPHATGRFNKPRNAQPPTRTGSLSTIRRFLNDRKIEGRATSATIARDAQAPAQKWGPAPKAMLFDVSRVTSKASP